MQESNVLNKKITLMLGGVFALINSQITMAAISSAEIITIIAADMDEELLVPTAITNAATAVTATGATLNGTVNDNGAATTVNFDFGATVSYGTTVAATPASIAAGTGNKVVTANKTGLTCNAVYHYRVKAVNSVGTTNGADQSFTTATCPLDLPVAVTNAATAVAATSATLNGSVTSKGATATASFDFGPSTGSGTISYGETVIATPTQIYSGTAVAVSATKAGLVCNTAYNFRTKAVSSAGTGLGANQTFTTLTCPVNSWLSPPTSTVPRDLPFTLDLVVKSDGMKISNYEFAVTLDPAKLQFDTTYPTFRTLRTKILFNLSDIPHTFTPLPIHLQILHPQQPQQ